MSHIILANQEHKILKPRGLHIPQVTTEIMRDLEQVGRICYKSEDKITDTSADNFIARLIRNGHHSILEHESLRIWFKTERGVTHELVRHRLASFAQESTRYVGYSGPIQFIIPLRFEEIAKFNKPEERQDHPLNARFENWLDAMLESSNRYHAALKMGEAPQEARDVLPNSLKTEIIVTANLREWRYVLGLRTGPGAHPMIKALMRDVLMELQEYLPIIFGDIPLEK